MSEFVAGWLVDAWIGSVYECVEDLLPSESMVLITAIDSSRGVAALVSVVAFLAERDTPLREIDGAVLVDRATFEAMLTSERDFFPGFGEVWFFAEGRVPETCPPDGLSVFEPPDAVPPELAAWMRATSCVLGVADGLGVSYAAAAGSTLATRLQDQR